MSIKDLLLNKHEILKSRAKGLERGEQVVIRQIQDIVCR